MSKLFSKPKTLIIVLALLVLSLAGVAGGPLGNAVGLGFLGSPMGHIQLAAEPVSPHPIIEVDTSPFIGDFKIKNTMVATWLAIIVLALIAFFGTRAVKEVPGRLQGVLEVVFEFFLNLCESVAGPERARRFFPLVMTIFLFIVTANWMGILPGFGSIGWIEPAEEVIEHANQTAEKDGDHANLEKVKLQVFEGDGPVAVLPFGSFDSQITAEEYEESGVGEGQRAGLLIPYLRSANTDINTTLSIALVAMFMVHWWGFSMLGIFEHGGKFLNLKGGPIWFLVGILEAFGEVARVLSFTFRLFGNIFAGEVLLLAMAFLVPLVGLVLPLALELFVGVIQAVIFAMLTLVFATVATASHGVESH